MDCIRAIHGSKFWAEAKQLPDPHFDPDDGITLADHLEAVAKNVRTMIISETEQNWVMTLRTFCNENVMQCSEAAALLEPAALLHDLGKFYQIKARQRANDSAGELSTERHAIISSEIGDHILPGDLPHRNIILGLIRQHDQPYCWYRQHQSTGGVPGLDAWIRLGRKVSEADPNSGLVLLCLLKFADVHGHKTVRDSSWFCVEANRQLLSTTGLEIPVPSTNDFLILPGSG